MTSDGRRPVAGAAVLRDDITTALQDAVVRELAAVGYGRMSIEAVARRAGVAKTAVYRRWPSKLEMVLELVTKVAGPKLPQVDAGSLSSDIEMVLWVASRALRHPLASQVIPDLLAEAARNPQIAETLQQTLRANQREIGVGIVERAVGRGELAAGTDPELAVDLIVGPLYWRLAVARTPVPADYIARLAAAAALALSAAAPATTPVVATASP